jgi:spermidine synthase
MGVACVSMAGLMTELLLMRVFDVILSPNMAYLIITCAMFAIGLSGIFVTLRPLAGVATARPRLALVAIALAGAALALLPLLNLLPFDFDRISDQPVRQTLAFLAMYLGLILPFFLVGLVFATVFSVHAHRIRRLYFWDLAGAATGAALVVPLVDDIGPGGLLFLSAALALLGSAAFALHRGWSRVAPVLALILVAVPLLHAPRYLDFRVHANKRGLTTAATLGQIEFTRWDPVSKIDVIPEPDATDAEGRLLRGTRKHVAYDGGSQSTMIYPFDGDFSRLRAELTDSLRRHFWQRGVVASHYLRRDSGRRVLIIGSAGGQETKAALLFGAGEVDAVEMVGAVVDLVRDRYAEYGGRLFSDPRVRVHVGEGRSFLRSGRHTYDIIQVFSNHTSSSIASGAGSMAPTYLQTVEAYREYFGHLTGDGILHINHHFYPRMITTAAAAWRSLGRDDFARHVVVYAQMRPNFLPTLLIKMSPWTQTELDELHDWFEGWEGPVGYHRVEDPLDPDRRFLPDAVYSGDARALRPIAERADYWLSPSTDDRPFFNFLRRRLGRLSADPARLTNESTAMFLNSQLRGFVPMDVIHLVVTSIVALFFALVFVLVPLHWAEAGRAPWPAKAGTLLYFSCLGAGFILLELVLINVFQHFVGSPLHTYTTVLFTMLLAAGVGSASSGRLAVSPESRWRLPFLGVIGYGSLLILAHRPLFDALIGFPTPARIAMAGAVLFPLGFFLGMPFPLGILAIEGRPRGAVAWAWGMNGLFTVVGGVLSGILSLLVGLRATLWLAIGLYGVAWVVFGRLRRAGWRPVGPDSNVHAWQGQTPEE